MTFSEQLKLEVKKLSHFKCCICWTFEFVDVHHIIPQSDGGEDTIDNAAPLCTRCHDAYGGNPDKRKWITQKRDFWYTYCKEKLYNEDINELQKIHETIKEIKRDSSRKEEKISELYIMVQTLLDSQNTLSSQIGSVPLDKKGDVIAQIGSAAITIATGSGTISQDAYYAQHGFCPNCGAKNDPGTVACEDCGSSLM